MARIFIAGSSDGLGLAAAQLLVEQGHGVVLHARSQQRAEETQNKLPAAESVLVGDLTSIAQTRHVADQVNQLGTFDAVIHNAGIGYRETKRIVTEDALSHLPGWAPTKMGGSEATDDLDQAHRTQVWLAVSDDLAAAVSGGSFYHMNRKDPLPAVLDVGLQDRDEPGARHESGIARIRDRNMAAIKFSIHRHAYRAWKQL